MQQEPFVRPVRRPIPYVRVLIVDGSIEVCRLLTELLSAEDPDIDVIGVATDACTAREYIKQLRPDVVTLDIEMPGLDGLTFVRDLMRFRPMPVVIVSSLTAKGVEPTLDALAMGAVDCLPRPTLGLVATVSDYGEELRARIKAAARARVRDYESHGSCRPRTAAAPPVTVDAVVMTFGTHRLLRRTERIIAIGASPGGAEAIRQILTQLPADMPGVLVIQHLPGALGSAFVLRLNACCRMQVCEARDGQPVLPGHVYFAPGDRHLLLARDGSRHLCRLVDGPPVNRRKPSADVLFRSIAREVGRAAIGVILTGTGKDGALGLREMREAGCATMAQDEATSVAWGMPGEAVAIGAAAEALPLLSIAARLQVLTSCADLTPAAT